MYELRERNELCDVTLKVNNENFHAHKVRCYRFCLHNGQSTIMSKQFTSLLLLTMLKKKLS